MRTNFQMISQFADYRPESVGFTSASEVERISNHFGLAEMTALELQNLRDFVVLFFQNQRVITKCDNFEAMLSITAVIDSYIYRG